MCGVRQKEVTNWTTSSVGKYFDRSPLGSYCDGDILDVCDPTPDGYCYILVIADYFSKWTEAFPIRNKCADTVADILVKIILRFGMPLVIHSDQGRESLCALLGVLRLGLLLTIQSRMAWSNALILVPHDVVSCSLTTGGIIGASMVVVQLNFFGPMNSLKY